MSIAAIANKKKIAKQVSSTTDSSTRGKCEYGHRPSLPIKAMNSVFFFDQYNPCDIYIDLSGGLCRLTRSQREVFISWSKGINIKYKDHRTSNPTQFVQANPDGSEFLVEIVIPEQNTNISDITYKIISQLAKEKEGDLYQKIYSCINSTK
ncbi:hypothetical protein LJC38_00505 [Parabacteroides sp. OttesenSCG-928-K15]|nr:hypothetical protein [Parabacteroides sp. OttesenSCG-928-K15]